MSKVKKFSLREKLGITEMLSFIGAFWPEYMLNNAVTSFMEEKSLPAGLGTHVVLGIEFQLPQAQDVLQPSKPSLQPLISYSFTYLVSQLLEIFIRPSQSTFVSTKASMSETKFILS